MGSQRAFWQASLAVANPYSFQSYTKLLKRSMVAPTLPTTNVSRRHSTELLLKDTKVQNGTAVGKFISNSDTRFLQRYVNYLFDCGSNIPNCWYHFLLEPNAMQCTRFPVWIRPHKTCFSGDFIHCQGDHGRCFVLAMNRTYCRWQGTKITFRIKQVWQLRSHKTLIVFIAEPCCYAEELREENSVASQWPRANKQWRQSGSLCRLDTSATFGRHLDGDVTVIVVATQMARGHYARCHWTIP